MVQPKYSPEEALQRVKLMMGYDMKKTLKENREVILEQIDLSGDIRDIKDEISSFNSDEDEIVKIIQKYKSKADFDALAKGYQDKYKQDFGTAIYGAINSNDPTESKQLQDHLTSIGITATTGSIPGDTRGNFKWFFNTGKPIDNTVKNIDADGKGGSTQKPKYTSCEAGKYVKGCKSDVVKKVQACLEMPAKYHTGNFGPITQGELQKKFPDLAKGFTDKDVDVICKKTTTTSPAVKDEFSVQVDADKVDDILNT